MALTVSLDDIVASGNSLLAIKLHWQRVRLGNVGHVLNGYAFKAELFTREGGMPLIRIRDVGSAVSETFYSGDYDERYVVNAGDLLVGMDGDFNCARWRGPRSLLNQRVCKITVDEALYLPRFLDYVLPGYLKAINDATSSITVKHLSSRTIQDIPLPLPPMDEQREIVAELEKQFSRLDEAVANLQRVKANLKRYRASVLKAAVEGRLVETEATLARREGRAYETGEQLLQRILEKRRAKWTGKGKYKEPSPVSLEGLSTLPHGWSYAAGGQLFRWSSGVNLPVKNLRGGEVPVYGGNGVNGWHTESNISYPTLVIGRVGAGCGNVHLVTRSAWITDNAIYATEVPASCDLRYLEIVFLTANLNSVAAGSGQPFVNQTILNDTLVSLPPSAEQTRIVAEVDRHLSIIREVETEVDANLQRAQALRQATLTKAFSQPLGSIARI